MDLDSIARWTDRSVSSDRASGSTVGLELTGTESTRMEAARCVDAGKVPPSRGEACRMGFSPCCSLKPKTRRQELRNTKHEQRNNDAISMNPPSDNTRPGSSSLPVSSAKVNHAESQTS
jgi:hypothetical protein